MVDMGGIDGSTKGAGGSAQRPTLGELFSTLIQQGKTLAAAEIRVLRVRVTRNAVSAGTIAGLVGAALMLSQALMVTILIGIMLILIQPLGLVAAVSIVCGVTLLLVILLLTIAYSRVTRLMKPEDGS